MNQLLDLDFVHTSPFSPSKWSWLGLLVLLCGLIIAWLTWQDYQESQIKLSSFQLKASHLVQQQEVKKTIEQPQVIALSPAQTKQVAEVTQFLVTPWDKLFLAIEKSSLPDVALLNLEPNPKKKLVSISGEAKSLQAVLDYIKQLELQPVFGQVYLQKHSIDQTNTSKPVSFTILANWQLSD